MKCSGCSAPQCLTVRTVTTCIPIHSCHVARIASSSSSCTSSSGSCCCPTAALPNNNRSYQEASTARQHVVARAGFGFGAKSKAGSSKANSKDCPCGSGKLYSKCCEVFHKSAAAHANPEQLIKARYSAFVKRVPKYLRVTSHPDNPALQGSTNTLPDGTVAQSTYEEDITMTMLAAQYTGLEVLGSQMSEDGNSCEVDVRATFQRLIDSTGKRVGKPEEEVWMERSFLVKDDEGNWLVKTVHAIEPAAST